MSGEAFIRRAETVDCIRKAEHPVTNLTKLLRWDGDKKEMSFPVGDDSEDSYVIIAQDGSSANIVAAGRAK